MKIKLLFLSLVLLATGVSLFGAHDFSGAYRHPNIPASKVVEADPPQVNTFCAANLSCTVTGAWSLGNVSSLTVSGTQTNTGLLQPKNLANVLYASQFAGADWAAKYNAADAQLGATPGTIIVDSSLAGTTATTTMAIASNHRAVFDGGTWTSSASPNITMDCSGCILEGLGDGSTGLGTTIANTNTSGGSVLSIGNGSTADRGINVRQLRMTGGAAAGSGIVLKANIAEVRLRDMYISTTGGNGVDGTAGNYANVRLEHVRLDSVKNVGFNFSSTLGNGPVSFYGTYANAVSGAASIGYDFSNGHYTLFGTASDNNTRAYRLASNVEMYGCEDEVSSTFSVQVIGSGTFVVSGHRSIFNAGVIFELDAANSNTTIITPISGNSTGTNGVVVAAAATGDNRIIGSTGLDKPINVIAGGSLKIESLTGWTLPEGTANGALASYEACYADSTAHALKCSYNNGSFGIVPNGSSGTYVPISAGGTDVGSAALPFGNFWVGTAVTNNFQVKPATLSAARVVNILDPGANSNMGLNFNVTSGTYVSKRGVSGCTTAASIGGICATAVTITWPGTFPDTNYSAGCSPSGAQTNLPSTPFIVSKANGSMTVNYFAITAAAASWATLDCWAIHD